MHRGKARNMREHVREQKITGTGGKNKTAVFGVLDLISLKSWRWLRRGSNLLKEMYERCFLRWHGRYWGRNHLCICVAGDAFSGLIVVVRVQLEADVPCHAPIIGRLRSL